jgi:hypothetical protein
MTDEHKTPQLTDSIVTDFFRNDEELIARMPAVKERYELDKRASPTGTASKLTPERYEAIIRYIKAGCHPVHASAAVGINEITVRKWVSEGMSRPDSIYGLFVQDLQRAKSTAVNRNVMIVNRAAPDDWKAAKWLLEILDPDVYGAKSTVRTELTTAPEKELKEVVITDDELGKLYMLQKMIEAQNEVPDNSRSEDFDDVNVIAEVELPVADSVREKRNIIEIVDVVEEPEFE